MPTWTTYSSISAGYLRMRVFWALFLLAGGDLAIETAEPEVLFLIPGGEVFFGVGIIAVMIVIQWKHELQSIGSSQATNNAAVGIGFIYFFPWIYLTVLGFCRELQKKLQKTI